MNKLSQKVTNEKSIPDKNHKDDFLTNLLIKATKYPKSILGFLIVITCIFGTQLPHLKFDYDFNSFFPKGDPDLAFYSSMNEDFGEYNNFLFICISSDSIRSNNVLSQIKAYQDSLSKWPQINSIESAFNQSKFQITPFGINRIPLLNTSGITPQGIENRGLFGSYFGKDNRSYLLIAHHEAVVNKEAGDSLYLDIKAFTASYLPYDFIISGKTQMQHDFTKKLELEVGKLLGLAFVVIVIVLLTVFRSVKGILLPIIVLIVTIIWIMGFVSAVSKPLDIMAIVIPALLLIVSVSDVIHFVNKYDILLDRGLSAIEAIREAIRSVGKATLLTSVTTAVGFASLVVIPVEPIRDFGLLTALGTLFAFFITILLLPSLLQFFPSRIQIGSKGHQKWKSLTNWIFISSIKRRKLVMMILASTTLIFLFGLNHTRVNTSILVGLQKGEPELETVNFFDQNFDGYKPFEIGLELTQERLFDLKTLTALDVLQDSLSRIGVKQIHSPLNIIKEINSALKGGATSQFRIPHTKDINRIERFYKSKRLMNSVSFFESENFIRIIGRLPDIGSYATTPIYNKTQELLTEFNTKTGLNAKLTGTSFLIDKTDKYVVSSIVKGLGVGILSVSLFLLIFFQEKRILFISILPNFLPVAVIAAFMGWFNIDLNITTVIIFTITFGIAIDDTIHLLAKYQMEKRKGLSNFWAIKTAINQTGKSIIITSVILILGFSVFLLSGFSIPYYMGLLIMLSTSFALLYDLTLLPIFLSKKKG